MVRSFGQVNANFFFDGSLNGLAKDARFAKSFITWLVDPKIEHNSFKFRGIGIDFDAKVLSSERITLDFDILKPSDSFSRLKILQFGLLTAKFFYY